MTALNTCQEQSCTEKIRGGHHLCRRHWQENQDGIINECPQCGAYKNAKYELCRDCETREQETTSTEQNTCKAQYCHKYIQRSRILCREHWRESKDGVINECPQCGVYKNARFDICFECFKKDRVEGIESPKSSEDKQDAPQKDPVDTFAERIALLEEDRKAQDKRLLFDYQQNKCVYCGNEFRYDKLEIEHMVPKIRGGQDNIRNFQLACRDCNQSKDTMTDIEFRRKNARNLPQQERTPANPPIKPELLSEPAQSRPIQRFQRK